MSPPRNDIETTSAGPPNRCRHCGAPFHRIRRQTYCSPACRQAAWRVRQIATTLANAVPAPPLRHRREVTIYACTECDQRYLGEQWCTDCARPCTRIGIGGTCPSCDEPVAVDELLQAHNDHLTGTQPGEPSLHGSRGGSVADPK